MRRAGLASLLAILAFAGVLVGPALVQERARAQGVTPVSNATIHLLAIDADPTGNTSTSLGPIDGCIRVEEGAQFDVDVVVDSIPRERQLIGWQMVVRYDPALLEVEAVDKAFLIASEGHFQPWDVPGSFSDILPDKDGSLVEAFADLASNSPRGANMESGPGILMRITLRAKAPGLAAVYIDQDGISINDNVNTAIGIDSLGAVTVAVGQDCPSLSPETQITVLPPTVTPTPAGAGASGTGGPPPEGTAASGATPVLGLVAPPPTPVPAMPGLGEGAGGSAKLAAALGGALGALGAAVSLLGSWLLYQKRRSGMAGR